jgi:hypothetical protein
MPDNEIVATEAHQPLDAAGGIEPEAASPSMAIRSDTFALDLGQGRVERRHMPWVS